MKAPAVSIIVLCRDGWADTRLCLAAVRRHTRPGSYEIIIVDNASSAATAVRLRAAASGWAEARLIRNRRNLSFARANNEAARAARGRFLLWLNNDTLPGPGWLDGLLGVLGGDPDFAAAGPMTGAMAPPLQLSARFETTPAPRPEETPFLGGFCCLLRRDAMERVGALDERFVWGWEDMDYCLRLRRAGFRLALARNVFVRHAGNRSIRRMPKVLRKRTDIANRRLFVDKWFSSEGLRRDAEELVRGTAAPWDGYRPDVSIPAVSGGGAAFARRLAGVLRGAAGMRVEILAVPKTAREAARLRGLARGRRELRLLAPAGARARTASLNEACRVARGDIIVHAREGLAPSVRLYEGLVTAALGRPRSGGAVLGDLAVAVRAGAFARVGGFDERFLGGGEVADYARRLAHAGIAVHAMDPRSYRRAAARLPAEDLRLLFEKWPVL